MCRAAAAAATAVVVGASRNGSGRSGGSSGKGKESDEELHRLGSYDFWLFFSSAKEAKTVTDGLSLAATGF